MSVLMPHLFSMSAHVASCVFAGDTHLVETIEFIIVWVGDAWRFSYCFCVLVACFCGRCLRATLS